jgi:hypothetical protein
MAAAATRRGMSKSGAYFAARVSQHGHLPLLVPAEPEKSQNDGYLILNDAFSTPSRTMLLIIHENAQDLMHKTPLFPRYFASKLFSLICNPSRPS